MRYVAASDGMFSLLPTFERQESAMVLKGCEKRVVHIKSPENPLFEEAYFFLKNQSSTMLPSTDLWREAEKIVNQSLLENMQGEKKETSNRLFYLLSFTVGVFLGIGSTALIFLL